MQKSKVPQIVVRFPHEVKEWLIAKTVANFSSPNVEIVRSVCERMERESSKSTST